MRSKMFTADFRVCWPDFAIARNMRCQNIISKDSDIVLACRTGDVALVQKLFSRGMARPYDTTDSNWPLLDVGRS